MALKPKDLVLSSSELAETDALEAKIDEVLKRKFVQGEACNICIPGLTPHGNTIHTRIRHELVRRYNRAGWHTRDYQDSITFFQK